MTQMNCGDFEALIALEVAGDLPAAEVAPVQRHLSECESCRSFAAELAADLRWLQSAHQEPLDSAALHQVRVGVMRRLESEQSHWDRPFGGLTMLGWRWQWVATAAAIAIFGGLAWWGATLHRPAVVALDARIESGPESGAPPSGAAKLNASEPGDRNSQRREGTESQTHQKIEPAVAQGGAPSEGQSAGGQAARPDSEDKQPPRRSSQDEITPVPQLARLDPVPGAAAGPHQPRPGGLGGETQAEIVTALLNEPLEEPTEVVMLKIPTSNPDIVVYWLMDEEKQPQADVQNQGD